MLRSRRRNFPAPGNCLLRGSHCIFTVLRSRSQHRWDLLEDRGKGSVLAVALLDTVPSHFFCFRHLMENFDRTFNLKPLKTAAWTLARALNESEFATGQVAESESGAASGLMGVGKETWALCYTLCPRFGTLTSNNAESVNGALRKIRKLPFVDCLMAAERYVRGKWALTIETSSKRGLLNHRATTKWRICSASTLLCVFLSERCYYHRNALSFSSGPPHHRMYDANQYQQKQRCDLTLCTWRCSDSIV